MRSSARTSRCVSHRRRYFDERILLMRVRAWLRRQTATSPSWISLYLAPDPRCCEECGELFPPVMEGLLLPPAPLLLLLLLLLGPRKQPRHLPHWHSSFNDDDSPPAHATKQNFTTVYLKGDFDERRKTGDVIQTKMTFTPEKKSVKMSFFPTTLKHNSKMT